MAGYRRFMELEDGWSIAKIGWLEVFKEPEDG
jgi:hypothetical protein